MNDLEYSSYLAKLGTPTQFTFKPDEASLFLLVRSHLAAIPYQSHDLFKGHGPPGLSTAALLSTFLARGGHCYQHSELMYRVLVKVGFTVERVPSYVLLGKPYEAGMPAYHNVLIVTIGEDKYLVDVAFSSGSPSFPVKLSFTSTEMVDVSPGEHYKLEVEQDHFSVWAWMGPACRGGWFNFYRFDRLEDGGYRVLDDKQVQEMYEDLYVNTFPCDIRDSVIKISIINDLGKIDLMYVKEIDSYFVKVFRRGVKVREDKVEEKEFYEEVKKYCNVDLLEEEKVK